MKSAVQIAANMEEQVKFKERMNSISVKMEVAEKDQWWGEWLKCSL